MDTTLTTTTTPARTYFRATTASQRQLLFSTVATGGTVIAAARQAHVGRGTYYYWRDRYVSEPYYRDGYTYDDYAPAYGVGMGSALAEKYRGRPFDEYEADLARDWDIYRGESRLTWPEASPAARAAWERAQRDRGAV